MRNVRSIDLTLPVLVVAGFLVAANPPDFLRERSIAVPVTGTIANPCSGEEVVLGGTAQVAIASVPTADGGFRVEMEADLSGANATNESGVQHDLGGTAIGQGLTYGPFPAALQLEGRGIVRNRSAREELWAELRFHVSVEQDGSAAPTGAVEVTALDCRSSRRAESRLTSADS